MPRADVPKGAAGLPAVYLGLPVGRWETAKVTAEWLEIGLTQVRELARRGLPSLGSRLGRRYPWPHVGLWRTAQLLRADRGWPAGAVPFALALAEHKAHLAISDAKVLASELGTRSVLA